MTEKHIRKSNGEKSQRMTRRRSIAKKRRKRRIFIAGVSCIAAALILVLLIFQIKKLRLTAYGETGIQEKEIGQEAVKAAEEDSAVFRETAGENIKLMVEDVDITGLTREEAETILKERYSGILMVRVQEETVELDNPAETEIKRLLDRAQEQPKKEMHLTFDYDRMESEIRNEVEKLAGKWNRRPIDSRVTAYDKKTGVYEYSREQDGRILEQDRLTKDIMRSVKEHSYTQPVEAVFSVTPAARTQAQAKEQYQVIGTFTTKLTNNKNRNRNVILASEAIDGLILEEGEEFSFNNTTGNRTREKGYQPAGAYRNGVLIEEPGGGVCQVSTTLYHSIIEAGFKTTERNAHSFAPSYVEKGQDAMVSFDGYAGPDLKFVNTSGAPVVLRASVQGLELKLSIVGIPFLEEGVRVSIRSEKVREAEPAVPVYEENTQLPFGSEQVLEQGQNGSVWKSYRVITRNGQLVNEEPLHNSYYKSKAGRIQRNITQPQPSEPGNAGESENTEQSGTKEPANAEEQVKAEEPESVQEQENSEGEASERQADAGGAEGPAGPAEMGEEEQ